MTNINQRAFQLNKASLNTLGSQTVIYLMSRDQRIQDNYGLMLAQELAIKYQRRLIVVFNLNWHLKCSYEHYEFMLIGLNQLAQRLKTYNIPFYLMQAVDSLQLADSLVSLQPLAIYSDFSPLHGFRNLTKFLARQLALPLYIVDSHNLIPAVRASDHQEASAYSFRFKVHKLIGSFLVDDWHLKVMPAANFVNRPPFNIQKLLKTAPLEHLNQQLSFVSGELAALSALEDFIAERLANFATARNDIAINGTSNLSPYLHFGQIASKRLILTILEKLADLPDFVPSIILEAKRPVLLPGVDNRINSLNVLIEELIVRKELADNFCLFASNYLDFSGASLWAKQTLNKHLSDDRPEIYDLEDLEAAQTTDLAWNAAQLQLVRTAKMHGYMRMYWAKKILEWSPSAEQALERAIYLNDKYSLDGYDPNGYVGILWSIAGVHDRPWAERPIFGKIRYMNYAGLVRKFDVASYINQVAQI